MLYDIIDFYGMINHFVVLIKLNTSPPTPENSLTEDAVGTFSILYACKMAKLVSKRWNNDKHRL